MQHTMTIERPCTISRPLPNAATPISNSELAGIEALCELVGDLPWRDHNGAVVIDDDDFEWMPAEIIPDFETENAAIPAFVAAAHNLMPRLIAEIRRFRGL